MSLLTDKKLKFRYRLVLCGILAITLLSIIVVYRFYIVNKIPDTILLRHGQEENVSFPIPVSAGIYPDNSDMYKNTKPIKAVNSTAMHTINEDKNENVIETPVSTSLALLPGSDLSYHMTLKIFGVIPVKSVNLNVVSPKDVYISGIPIGIYVKTKGVMVIDTGDFKNDKSQKVSPSGEILQAGDYILKVDGKDVKGKRNFIKLMEESNGKQMIMTIFRNGEKSNIKIQPEKNEDGIYKAGIWIRDSAQGIGTLTFVSEDGDFGALGHGINDIDTGCLMDLKKGSIYKTNILSVQRGTSDTPGELTGILSFDEDDYLGKIEQNTGVGIYGNLEAKFMDYSRKNEYLENTKLFPVALKQEVHVGPAQIFCKIGDKADYYDIKITQLRYDEDHKNQGIIFEIADEDLIQLTGGIVQGMSGSPIVQDGKLVGAVTHVLVKDATKGYAIFAETMVEQDMQ